MPVPRELVPQDIPPQMLQVMPPSPNPPPPIPPPPMYDSYGPVSIVHAMPGPPPPEMMLTGQTMVPVIGTLQPGPGPMGSVMSPPIQLHYSQLIQADQVTMDFYLCQRYIASIFNTVILNLLL